MNNSVKKAITSIIISILTLAAGFALTMLSFNLFDDLSVNQMRILLVFDIALLSLTGIFAYVFFENKKNKAEKRRAFENRHNSRTTVRTVELTDDNACVRQHINFNYVA